MPPGRSRDVKLIVARFIIALSAARVIRNSKNTRESENRTPTHLWVPTPLYDYSWRSFFFLLFERLAVWMVGFGVFVKVVKEGLDDTRWERLWWNLLRFLMRFCGGGHWIRPNEPVSVASANSLPLFSCKLAAFRISQPLYGLVGERFAKWPRKSWLNMY